MWVQRQLECRPNAPRLMVIVPDIFLMAAAAAPASTLAPPRSMGAATSGFTMILHTYPYRIAGK